ncbi:MAG: YaaA family protein [Rhodoglobus sp.]
MLILLPPSESKRDGGQHGTVLSLASLGFETLTSPRAATLAALRRLSRSVGESMRALALGPTQRFEVDRNRALVSSPALPALERYTGVLYDAVDVTSFSADQRAFADRHLVIHSALFGLLRGSDHIPAYRLSHNSTLPGLSLRRQWGPAITSALADQRSLVLDLRSESYVALGPAPAGVCTIRMVSEDDRGRRVALSHANKVAKGLFVRVLVQAGIEHKTVESLLDWARAGGIRLERTAGGLDMVL